MPKLEPFISSHKLERCLRNAAVVSALFDPWRDFRFVADFNTGVRTGVWRDHAGNCAFARFTAAATVLLGFDHESPMSPHVFATGPEDFQAWPGVYEELPPRLFEAIRETRFTEDFDYREVTFCLWNETGSGEWSKGLIEYPERDHGDPDGSRYILRRLSILAEEFEDEIREHYDLEDEKDENGGKNSPVKLENLLFAKLHDGERFTRDEIALMVSKDCDLSTVCQVLADLGILSQVETLD